MLMYFFFIVLFVCLLEGKAAMAISAAEFNRSASSNYAAMPEANKEKLKTSSVEPFKSKNEVIRQGGKIFKRLKSLVSSYRQPFHSPL